MGPKAKKTKKQLEEEKALAEQQKKIEEALELKRQEEEAERRRIEELKRKAEEEKRQREEKARLDEQGPKFDERSTQMIEKRKTAKQSRVRDLDDKFLLCDPLPDPENERELTTFITLWKESKDDQISDAALNCQTSENVIKALNLQLGEALAQYDFKKVQWCNNYIEEMRKITLHKFDVISTQIFTYIENYTKYTEEEKRLERENRVGNAQKKDLDQKPEFKLLKSTPDILMAIWANVQSKSQHYKFIEFERFSTHLPRQNASTQLTVRCLWTSFDYISGPENMKKFDDIVVGGIVYCRMFLYPTAAKVTSRWTMRQIKSIEDTLKEIPYPDPSSQSQSNDPVSAIFKLPDYVFTTENDEIKIGVWDEEQQCWSTEYVEELIFDRGKRQLEFNRKKFAPIAYLQSKITDFPYDSWYIRCIQKEVALLSIKTKRIQVNIEIHPLFVKLVEMTQPELQHLINQELHPGILLMELSKCGIHLLPEDDDARRAGIHLKNKDAEERAIMDISQTLKVFAFQSLKWNQQASEENIICRMRENPDNVREFFEDDESDWKSIMWWKNKVSYIKARNCDEAFNPDIYPGQLTHSMLSLAVAGIQSQDAVDKSQFVYDIDFIDNVQRMLRMLRLLAFTMYEYDKRSLEEQQQ